MCDTCVYVPSQVILRLIRRSSVPWRTVELTFSGNAKDDVVGKTSARAFQNSCTWVYAMSFLVLASPRWRQWAGTILFHGDHARVCRLVLGVRSVLACCLSLLRWRLVACLTGAERNIVDSFLHSPCLHTYHRGQFPKFSLSLLVARCLVSTLSLTGRIALSLGDEFGVGQ